MNRYIIYLLCWLYATAIIGQEERGVDTTYNLPTEAELLSSNINTATDDYRPIITADGQQLFYVRKSHPQNIGRDQQEDIWLSRQTEDGRWKRSIHLGPIINNRLDNQLIGASPTGHIIYLAVKDQGKQTVSIFRSNRKGRSWTNPTHMPIEGYEQLPISTYLQLSPNGDLLLLCLEGADGQRDIYLSHLLPSGSWSQPETLGPQINTDQDEAQVFLATDYRSLYFSSNGHEGQGGQDIFLSRRMGESMTEWTAPINLGDAFNTPVDDPIISIPASGEFAYFGAMSETGKKEIYQLPLAAPFRPHPIVLIKGKVLAKARDKKQIQSLHIHSSKTAHRQEMPLIDGAYSLLVPYGHDIDLSAETAGYFPITQRIQLTDNWKEPLDGDQQLLADAGSKATLPVDLATIERLQLRLNVLNKDIQKLEQEQLVIARKTAIQKQKKLSSNKYRTDPELDALKHKYEHITRGQKETSDRRFPDKSDNSDKALDELKQKYARHFERSDTKKKMSSEEELNDLRRKVDQQYNSGGGATTPLPAPAFSTDFPQEFSELELEINKELEQQLRKPIKRQLLSELFPKMTLDFERVLSPEQQPLFNNNLRKLTLKNLESKLDDIDKVVTAPTYTTTTSPKIESIKKDIRKKLKPEVTRQLRKELSPNIQDMIKKELEYSLKKATKAKLEARLRNQIQIQKQESRPLEISKNTIASQPQSTQRRSLQIYQEIEKDLSLVPLKEGAKISLNTIIFETNQSELLPSSLPELQRVASLLMTYPTMKIEIGSHTNAWVGYGMAHLLTTQRAKAVADYLINAGIHAERIESQGYGSSQPLASNNSEDGRRSNQRIELSILEK